ncbi:MAG: phosphotransferase, partial [Eubacterium sp.]|nr:phosphotransferase [Eubacterium sp.]
LGLPVGKPKRISGGYMHKMYRIKTSNGDYAVKLLNPVIMQRENVMENYALAESLEVKLQLSDIPVVPALEFNGKKMQCIDNQYFYVFDWVNGKSLNQKQIKKEHCETIGKILAKIHKLECSEEYTEKNDIVINWDFYIEKAKEICPKVSKILLANKELLYKSMEKGNSAYKRIPKIVSVSNGDMDSKNVLWVDDKPKIIDLECLNYGNPFTELFQLSLCWCGYEHCKINYDLLGAFVQSYIAEYGGFNADWEDLYYSNIGRLEWLEYNVKRALLIECNDKAEQKLGIDQVKETMKHIVYYENEKDNLLSYLKSIDNLKSLI